MENQVWLYKSTEIKFENMENEDIILGNLLVYYMNVS